MVAQDETTPATADAVDASGSVLNSPRIVGGQDVTDRTQYAYQVGNLWYLVLLLGK